MVQWLAVAEHILNTPGVRTSPTMCAVIRTQQNLRKRMILGLNIWNAASHVGRNGYIDFFGIRKIQVFHNVTKLRDSFPSTKPGVCLFLSPNGRRESTFIVVCRIHLSFGRKCEKLGVNRRIQLFGVSLLKVCSATPLDQQRVSR